jgi:hypothetical protein
VAVGGNGNTVYKVILLGITSSKTRNPPEENHWLFHRELPGQGLGSHRRNFFCRESQVHGRGIKKIGVWRPTQCGNEYEDSQEHTDILKDFWVIFIGSAGPHSARRIGGVSVPARATRPRPPPGGGEAEPSTYAGGGGSSTDTL